MQTLTYLIAFQAKQTEILARTSTTLKMNYHRMKDCYHLEHISALSFLLFLILLC